MKSETWNMLYSHVNWMQKKENKVMKETQRLMTDALLLIAAADFIIYWTKSYINIYSSMLWDKVLNCVSDCI